MKEKINKLVTIIYKNDIYIFGVFFLLSFIIWHLVLSNSFINDDFQVLGWLRPKIFADIFKPFYEKEPILFYWRPIVNFLNSLTIFIFGYKPLPFLVQNLIVYSLISFLIFEIIKKLGVNRKTSFLFALFFFALPSHDLPIAWLACRYDLFMTLFILLTVYYYLKIIFSEKNNNKFNFFLVFLFSFLAIISKEHAFFLVGLGFIMYIIEPKKKKIHFTFTIIIAFFIAIYFLFRAIVIGGSPLSSTNFSNINFLDILTNFFLYIITSIIHPELFLNFIRYKDLDIIFITQIVLSLTIGILLIFLIIKNRKYLSFTINNNITQKNEFRLILFGLLLYILSVIPVLPLYMRWYSFFPFIGVIFLLSGIYESLNKYVLDEIQNNSSIQRWRLDNTTVIRLLIYTYIFLCFIFNYSQARNWNLASKEITKVLKSLSSKQIKQADTITLWGIPDKIEGISAMKLGVEQAVHYAIENEIINVKAPLRMECNGQYSMNIIKINDSTFRFVLNGGILRHQFTDRFNIDSIYYNNDEYRLKITNVISDTERSGFADLVFKKRVYGNVDLVWTGERFIEF
jgi:hypothetical protein